MRAGILFLRKLGIWSVQVIAVRAVCRSCSRSLTYREERKPLWTQGKGSNTNYNKIFRKDQHLHMEIQLSIRNHVSLICGSRQVVRESQNTKNRLSLQSCSKYNLDGKVRHGVLSVRKMEFSCVAASATSICGIKVLEEEKKMENPIVVIDNYDSFTYNLCQYMGELGANFEVYRNDEITVEELKRKNPRGILISPGPGAPQDSGISLETIVVLGPSIPIFGVCMGLQCMGEAFGGKIVRSRFGVMHGKSSPVYYDEKRDDGLFSGLSNPFIAGRYHSLVIENESFPNDELEITAWTEDGLIMAICHKKYRHIQGVQFHPESMITVEGKKIVSNFINLIERFESESYQSC